MKSYTDTELIEFILNGPPRKRSSALEFIYKHYFPTIEKLVQRNQGSTADARDIFQEAIAIFYKNLVSLKFRNESSVKTYIGSICRNLWYLQLRDRGKPLMLPAEDASVDSSFVNTDILNRRLVKLDKGCQEILIGFYYERKSMSELAGSFKLGSEQAAKTKKFRCLQKLRHLFAKDRISIENFQS